MGKNSLSLNFSLKKILSLMALINLLSSYALAEDFLAKLTNNALSDNSQGVKKLTYDEASKVVGGYLVRDFGSGNEWYAVALYSSNELQKGGLCGLGVANCSAVSQRRLVEYSHIVGDTVGFFPVYIVKRSIQVSHLGRRYVLFNYQVGILDSKMQLYKFDSTTSSILLKNNMIMKELQNQFKANFESKLGGWSVR